jgi:hypothetical protein
MNTHYFELDWSKPSYKEENVTRTISIVGPTRSIFLYSVYYELTASTCFEHYLLIFRRRYINNIWLLVHNKLNTKDSSCWSNCTDTLRYTVNKTLSNSKSYQNRLCDC